MNQRKNFLQADKYTATRLKVLSRALQHNGSTQIGVLSS